MSILKLDRTGWWRYVVATCANCGRKGVAVPFRIEAYGQDTPPGGRPHVTILYCSDCP